jgi:hypothetical protein
VKHNWHLKTDDYGPSGGQGLICFDALDPNEAFIQDYFISFVLSDQKMRRTRGGEGSRSN